MTDAIDLALVRVEGSNPEVLTWPITSELQEFWIRPGVMHVRYDKQGQWPPVDMGGALQEATVWVFVNVAWQWIATGAERLRPNQIDKPQSDRPVETIGTSWLYARDRWPTLAGYVPQDGERVGFMVAAGSTRSDFQVTVRERTNVILTRFSDRGGGAFELVSSAAPTPPAPQPPTPPAPQPPTAPVVAGDDLERLTRIEAQLASQAGMLQAIHTTLGMLAKDPETYRGSITIPRFYLGGKLDLELKRS